MSTRWLRGTARGYVVVALVLASGMGVSETALAQTGEADKSAAETLFDEGRRLSGEGKFAEACLKFADSNKLDPGVGTLLNLGQCYKSLGRSASAWSTFREAAAMARASGQSDRETLARNEVSALESSLIRLSIEVPPEVAAANPQIRRDGTAVPQSLWGLPTPVDRGVHVVEVTAAGKKPQRFEVPSATAGTISKVVIPALIDEPSSSHDVPSASASGASSPAAPAQLGPEAPGANAPSAPLAPVAPASGGSGVRLTGFVVGGIGVAALGAGVVFLVLGKNENELALGFCTGGPSGEHCSNVSDRNNHETHVRAARDNFRIGYVGLGVGAAGVVTGVVLVALGSSGSKPAASGRAPSTPRWALAPRVGVGELGLDWSARF